MTPERLEQLAQRLAAANGEEWDRVAEDDHDWKKHKGFFYGRFRGLNEPMRCDYRAMALAAAQFFARETETRV